MFQFSHHQTMLVTRYIHTCTGIARSLFDSSFAQEGTAVYYSGSTAVVKHSCYVLLLYMYQCVAILIHVLRTD